MTLILSTIEAELLQEYQKKFDELKKFAFELHKLDKWKNLKKLKPNCGIIL